MSGSCVLGYRDWTRSLGVGVTGSAEVAGMPASNLPDPQVGRRWRIAATAGSVTVDLGQARAMDVLVAVQPWDSDDETRGYQMLASTDTVQHQLGTTAGGSDVYDSGVIACGIQQGYGLHAHFPPATQTARYWTFNFTSSAPQAFTDWGKLFCGPLILPSLNPIFGYADEWRDASAVGVAPRSGVEYVDQMQRQRAVSLAFDYLTESEGRDTFKELARVAALRGQVFFARDKTSTYLGREAILGRFEKPVSIAAPVFQAYSAQFVIRQSL